MTPGPGWRKCTVYRRPGPGGMPLGLALTEGLGDDCTLSLKPSTAGSVAGGLTNNAHNFSACGAFVCDYKHALIVWTKIVDYLAACDVFVTGRDD